MRALEHSRGGPGPGRSAGRQTPAGLAGSRADRWIGMWSARVLFAIGVSYAVIMIIGFAAMGTTSKPLGDPYLAIMEVLILIMAPILVLLTVARRIDPNAIHGYQYLFTWHWPSMLYGVDIVAWDIFFGLALLFAAPVFHASGHVAVRNGMLIAGALSVVGIIGPALNHIALRQIGIIGYAIIWPIVCLPLSKAFRERPIADAAASPLALERESEDAS